MNSDRKDINIDDVITVLSDKTKLIFYIIILHMFYVKCYINLFINYKWPVTFSHTKNYTKINKF